MLTTEQVVAMSTAILTVIQLLLHIWSDYRRQQQTKQLLSKPIHLEITLTDTGTDNPAINAKLLRNKDS